MRFDAISVLLLWYETRGQQIPYSAYRSTITRLDFQLHYFYFRTSIIPEPNWHGSTIEMLAQIFAIVHYTHVSKVQTHERFHQILWMLGQNTVSFECCSQGFWPCMTRTLSWRQTFCSVPRLYESFSIC